MRALRIRELENQCACQLSENLELRGRILELEKQVEDNDARRIADHALAVKAKLEAQLTEWGALLAGLGLEPPMKRHSPRVRKSMKQRMSFNYVRPSPSQRRLRDISQDIEELGQIPEHKSYPRMTLECVRSQNTSHQEADRYSPDQIQALRSRVDESEEDEDENEDVGSPELGPPPMSHFIDAEPVKHDSPPPKSPAKEIQSSSKGTMDPPVLLPSPQPDRHVENSPSPQKQIQPRMDDGATDSQSEDVVPHVAIPLDLKPKKPTVSADQPAQPAKAGMKRKFAGRDDAENARPAQKPASENQPPRMTTQKGSIRERTGGKTLKDMSNMRKDITDKPVLTAGPRKALAPKSTNDDMTSPVKKVRPAASDEIAIAKATLNKPKPVQEKRRGRPKNPTPVQDEAAPTPEPPAPVSVELLSEPHELTPSSPEPAHSAEAPREGTPPPVDISPTGEAARGSRRNRTAVSYAEPNLRDKMRRPGKQMMDAVAGYRRTSQSEPLSIEGKVKRESASADSLRHFPPADSNRDSDYAPASPLAHKGETQELPSSVTTERRRRPSSIQKMMEESDGADEESEGSKMDSTAETGDDVYEFQSSSPQAGKKRGGRQRGARRASAAVDSDDDFVPMERASARRRSMMV